MNRVGCERRGELELMFLRSSASSKVACTRVHMFSCLRSTALLWVAGWGPTVGGSEQRGALRYLSRRALDFQFQFSRRAAGTAISLGCKRDLKGVDTQHAVRQPAHSRACRTGCMRAQQPQRRLRQSVFSVRDQGRLMLRLDSTPRSRSSSRLHAWAGILPPAWAQMI